MPNFDPRRTSSCIAAGEPEHDHAMCEDVVAEEREAREDFQSMGAELDTPEQRDWNAGLTS